jgi:hypothetical protein
MERLQGQQPLEDHEAGCRRIYPAFSDARFTIRVYEDLALWFPFQPGKAEKAENLQSPNPDELAYKGKTFCRATHTKTHRQNPLSVPALRIFRFAQNRSFSAGGVKTAKLLKKSVLRTGSLCYFYLTKRWSDLQ